MFFELLELKEQFKIPKLYGYHVYQGNSLILYFWILLTNN
jgi:hypothetical protein